MRSLLHTELLPRPRVQTVIATLQVVCSALSVSSTDLIDMSVVPADLSVSSEVVFIGHHTPVLH